MTFKVQHPLLACQSISVNDTTCIRNVFVCEQKPFYISDLCQHSGSCATQSIALAAATGSDSQHTSTRRLPLTEITISLL